MLKTIFNLLFKKRKRSSGVIFLLGKKTRRRKKYERDTVKDFNYYNPNKY